MQQRKNSVYFNLNLQIYLYGGLASPLHPPLVKLLVAPLEGRVGMRWKETIGKQSLFSKYWIWLNNLSLSHHSVLQVGK